MTAIAPRQPEPRSAAGRRAVLVLAVMIALGAAGYGDEKPIPEADAKKAQAEAARVAVALSEAVGLRRPIETLVGTVAATSKWSSPAKKTPPRVSDWFEKYPVTDGAPLPLWKDDAPETQLYCYLLSLAQQVERSTFERAARKDVVYEQVFAEPEKTRGEVVHVEGILRKLKRVEAPEPAKARGVDQLYIGWVFDPKNPNLNRPWYVVFTRLPTKFDFKDRPDRRVTFDGYFFKRLRFEVEDSWFDAPLVIGRTVALVNELPSDVEYRQRGAAAAASLPALGGPLQMAAPLVTGVFNQTWPVVERKPWDGKLPDVAAKLDLSAFTIIDKEPVLSYDQDRSMSAEAIAFSNVLVTAHKLPKDALKKGARTDVTYAHLMNQSEKYRGEVVHLEGTLARVRRYDPSRFSKPEGIEAEYEGWIYDPKSYGANPMCIYFSELPEGVEVKERLNVPIKFDGYFFKRYRYKTGATNKNGDVWRDAPLLIGKTIEASAFDTTPVQQGITTNKDMITAFLGLLMLTMTLALGIAFFYRRGDRAIRSRIAGASALSFTEAQPDEGIRPNPTGSDPSQFTGFPQGSN